MNDFEIYASGWMNQDEQEQWNHVTEMMAAHGEYDGHARDHQFDSILDDEDFNDSEKPVYGNYIASDEIPF